MEANLKQCSNDKEILKILRMLHGKDVLCTDGLFHMIDNNHNEAYINKEDASLDKRGLYRTLVVMDNIVVSRVVNNSQVSFVILNKNNLECIYKTSGNIFYLDKDLVCDSYKNKCMLISHTGKYTKKFDDAICINKIYKNFYLLSSSKMFSDKILMYNKHKDTITDITENKRYTIHRYGDSMVSIAPMSGGKYTYDFTNRQAVDEFSGDIIDTVILLNT